MFAMEVLTEEKGRLRRESDIMISNYNDLIGLDDAAVKQAVA